MKSAIYLMSIVILALGLYAYDVRQENTQLQQTVHAQYTNSLTKASEKLTSLQQSVSQSLLFQDQEALEKELDNIWRTSNEFRSSISNLPLSTDVANDWLRYVGNIGEEAKYVADNGDYDEWYKKMGTVNENLQALSDEWAVATSNYYQNDGDFKKWANVAANETKESPFKNVSANLKSYTETDFPLTASESDWKKKQELQNLNDKEITKDQAIDKLELLLPGIKDATYTVTQSKEDAPYPFYHIQFVKGSRIGYADITVKGGHILSFLSERPVQEQTGITQQQIKDLTNQFLERAGYKDLQLVEMRENHDAWHISLARVAGKHKALVYPDGIQLKVSKDSGELLGFNAMEYVQKETVDENQPVNPVDWNTFFRPGTFIEEERMIYTENEGFQLRLCYEVIARFDNKLNETFRVVVDAENHDVIKVEYMP
ncbi:MULTISPECIES: PepSY1/2 domain-containing protein [Lysinibacillus]|uniref:Sporulation protein n=1 Tax=Lysinibacillus antri TaxID=2498145 RepID=A0A432L7B9_9BACI|nr:MULTISPECIES: PepSY1/2 domain-containing protein [Lysinibacillus]RUL47393.1 sporulation protein [Lysinibacillus antri]TSI09024.1 sporulation protein [Lysinibacillus sp. BW-2-10]